MSRIHLTEPELLPDGLRELHDGAAVDDWPTRHVTRAFASAPDLLTDYLAFYYPWHSVKGRLEPRLKELVRLYIATLNGCQTCATARLAPETVGEEEAKGALDLNAALFSERERAALRFAEQLAISHHSISDADVEAVRRYFDDAEFLELAMMAGQYIGFGRVLATLQLQTEACSITV